MAGHFPLFLWGRYCFINLSRKINIVRLFQLNPKHINSLCIKVIMFLFHFSIHLSQDLACAGSQWRSWGDCDFGSLQRQICYYSQMDQMSSCIQVVSSFWILCIQKSPTIIQINNLNKIEKMIICFCLFLAHKMWSWKL